MGEGVGLRIGYDAEARSADKTLAYRRLLKNFSQISVGADDQLRRSEIFIATLR
jgi:hypothetical protein